MDSYKYGVIVKAHACCIRGTHTNMQWLILVIVVAGLGEHDEYNPLQVNV